MRNSGLSLQLVAAPKVLSKKMAKNYQRGIIPQPKQ